MWAGNLTTRFLLEPSRCSESNHKNLFLHASEHGQSSSGAREHNQAESEGEDEEHQEEEDGDVDEGTHQQQPFGLPPQEELELMPTTEPGCEQWALCLQGLPGEYRDFARLDRPRNQMEGAE